MGVRRLHLRRLSPAGSRSVDEIVARQEVVLVFVIVLAFIPGIGRVLITFVLLLLRDPEQRRTIRRPLVRANDELAEELVAEAVEVAAVELGVGALLEVLLCASRLASRSHARGMHPAYFGSVRNRKSGEGDVPYFATYCRTSVMASHTAGLELSI